MSYNKQIKWALLHLKNASNSVEQAERDLRKALLCVDAPESTKEDIRTGEATLFGIESDLYRITKHIRIFSKVDKE